MATQFFPLAPQGMGTEEIEALDSYVLRLATEHGVSECQFHRLLAWWWNHSKRDDQCELGRHITYVSKIGYGRDVDTLVQALEKGTGVKGLSSLTLTAFRDICGVHVGAFGRRVHHWCPACLQEQIREGLPIYEKLVWRLKAITRCSVHKIALENLCPWCKCHQVRHMNTWPRCSECDRSILERAHLWRPAPHPSEGEADMLEVIGYCALHPEAVFQRDAARQFWKLVRSDGTLGLHRETEYFHQRPDPTRTLIPSLLRFAQAVNVPLLSILLNPQQAASIRSLLSAKPSLERHDHSGKRLSSIRLKELKAALEQYLRTRDASQSFAKLCEPYGCTTTVARYWFPELSRAVTDHSRGLKKVVSEKYEQSLKSLSIDVSTMLKAGEIGWHGVEHELSDKHQVPLHRVRKRLSDLKGK